MTLWLQDLYLRLRFSSDAARLFIREWGLDIPERLGILVDNSVDGICIVMRKSSSKNADGTPDRGQQISVIAQENLKLAVFLLHHWWRCNFDERFREYVKTLYICWQDRIGSKISTRTQMCCLRSTRQYGKNNGLQ